MAMLPAWQELGQHVQRGSDSSVAGMSVAEVDCALHPNICHKAGVESLPSLLAFLRGEELMRRTGKRAFPMLLSFARQAREKAQQQVHAQGVPPAEAEAASGGPLPPTAEERQVSV